jgi:phage-related protein
MPTFPRTDDFAFLAGSLPADGAGWVAGDHIFLDKSDDEFGQMARWAFRDHGIEATDASTPATSWMAWRFAPANDNVRVKGRFFWRHVSGTEQPVQCGVMARLQAIGSTAAGPPARWYEASCYVAQAEIDPETETASLFLRRVDAGVVTDLEEVAGYEWPAGRSRELELRVDNVPVGKVRLYLLVGGEELAQFEDPAVSALTVGGLYGFQTMDAAAAGGESRTGIREFRASRYSNDTVYLHDDFDRPNRVDDAPEYHLRSLWGPFTGLEQVSGAIRPTSASEDAGRFAMYQVRPTEADYDVQADFTFATSDRHWGGLCVRASKASTAADLAGFTGYLARLRIDDAEDNLELLKVVAGTVIDIERASVSGLATATPITLNVQVDGDVDTRVRVRVNGDLELTYDDELADRHERAGQAGVYLLSATATPNVSAAAFELDDPDPAADTVTVPATGDEHVGLSEKTFAIVEISDQCNGSRTSFSLPAVPASDSAVALFWNGVRVRDAGGTPGAIEHSTDAASSTVRTGFAPLSIDRLIAEFPIDGNEDFVMGEVPAGTINGTNKQFTIAEEATAPEAVRVFVHGLRLKYAGTTTTPAVDEYSFPTSLDLRVGIAPVAGGQFCVDYPKDSAAPTNPVFGEVPAGSVNGVNQAFALAARPNSNIEAAVYINGYRLSAGYASPSAVEVGLSEFDVTLGDVPSGDDWLVADYLLAGDYEEVLDLVPDLPWTPTIRSGTIGARFEYGYEQVVPTMVSTRATYPLKASGITKAKRDYVKEFIDRRVGPYQQFLWTPPDSDEPVSVHLGDRSYREMKLAPDVYSVELMLEQLIVANP